MYGMTCLPLHSMCECTLNHVSDHLYVARHGTSHAAREADHCPLPVAQCADPMEGSLQMSMLCSGLSWLVAESHFNMITTTGPLFTCTPARLSPPNSPTARSAA